MAMEETKAPKVRWATPRQMQVGMACGFRVRDGRVENVRKVGEVEEGTAHHVIAGVRPASLAEQKMWDMLMQGEVSWGR